MSDRPGEIADIAKLVEDAEEKPGKRGHIDEAPVPSSFWNYDQVLARLHESRKGLTTLNGAGIAGIIGLMQRSGPIPLGIRAAGFLFLIGIFTSLLAILFGGPYPEEDPRIEGAVRIVEIANFASGTLFLAGTTIAFLSAG